MIFSFGRRYYQKTEAGKTFLPKTFVIGPFKNKLMLFSDGFTGFVAVRFKAWGLCPFSLMPIPGLVGQITPAEEIFGNKINGLIREMKGREREEKIEMVRQYLQGEFSETDRAKIASAPIGERIIAQNGIVSISDLAKQFGINSRQLERIFKTETGLSAKMFSRIIRFNHAKRTIENDSDISLSRLTYEMGYSDQAHFSKIFASSLITRQPISNGDSNASRTKHPASSMSNSYKTGKPPAFYRGSMQLNLESIR